MLISTDKGNFVDLSIYHLIIFFWTDNVVYCIIQQIYIRQCCIVFLMQSNSGLLDEVGLRIIDMLDKDASMSFVEIAKQIGVSDATVHIRVKRLLEAGIINRFTLSLDNERLGYAHLGFIGINVEPGFADFVISSILKIDEVLEIHEMHGTFDIFIKIRSKNLEEMREIVENKIGKIPHVLEKQLMTVLKTRKEEQAVSLKKDIQQATLV